MEATTKESVAIVISKDTMETSVLRRRSKDSCELSEENVMMAFEIYADDLSDNLSTEYIDFETEQELFKLFNSRAKELKP